MNIIKAQEYRLEAERLLRKKGNLDCIFPNIVKSRVKTAAELYLKAGNIYSGMSNWNQAQEYWDKSFKLNYSFDTGIKLAESYEKLIKPLDAINIYLEILDIENKFSKPIYKILYKLGINYMQLKNWDYALTYFYTCIDLTDINSTCYKILSSILAQKIHIDLKDFEKAALMPFKTLSSDQLLNLKLLDDLIININLNTHLLIGLICSIIINISAISNTSIMSDIVDMSKLNCSVLNDFITSPEYQIYLELMRNNIKQELIEKIKKLESGQTILNLISSL